MNVQLTDTNPPLVVEASPTGLQWIIAKYAFSLLCVCLATWVRMELDDTLGDRLPFGTYFLAVFFAAWLGGTGPGLVCLLASVFAAAHFIIGPTESWAINDRASQLSLLVFWMVGIVSIILFRGLERKTRLSAESFKRIEILNQQLTAADRAKDEFISVLAHELRNPLAAMQSGVELLLHPAASSSQLNSTCQLHAKHLAHMRHLVDDLFDVSRYLRGQLHLQFEVVDLREPVEHATNFVDAALKEKSQTLKMLLPAHPVMVRVDPVRITQAVSNLLVNACKFTPHAGCITLLVEQDDSVVRVLVKDSGVGIDPSMHAMIFEPFNQVVPGRARLNGGLGLGLTLVKKVIELHAGHVTVASAGLGRGSCFTIDLPTEIVPDSLSPRGDAVDPSREISSGPAFAGTSPLVLIVDDNQDAANTLATLLGLHGIQSRMCFDGVTAVQMVEEFKPDYVILDIGLPNMDGYEVARRIRCSRAADGVTLIALTGWGGEEHKRLAREAGITHHLTKPALLHQLLPLLVRRSTPPAESASVVVASASPS